ncbi:PREDICTED: BTB/POZ domain-containing protein At3g05675-like [Nicotiana attenuata]|uniref:Btbpoz domain-containing protein n=1 Tax=Nicotiana attenuata TaxID=49451 RepID=A0A1J6JJM3_NICAT|nr:PREDICTED: BTB/POZ domain-containing protein At3g05675-like [Nicotiana attenuata]OIT07137.1 btbpoz domain-containing protein [Nicotiana attenuata]
MTVGGGGGAGGVTSGKKRHRVGSNSRLSSTIGIIDSSRPDNTLTERSQKPSGIRRTSSHTVIPSFSTAAGAAAAASGGFNDSSTADVVLRLFVDQLPLFDTDDSESISAVDSDQSDVQIYLHSDILRRCKYFAALLSDRWQKESNDVVDSGNSSRTFRLNLGVPSTPGSIDHHLTVLQLLYTNDFSTTINTVSIALCLLPVALELIFEDCIKACVRFLEAVPWTEDEERKILNFAPFLGKEESQELLARVSTDENNSSEEMLHGLILSALHNHPNMAFAKAFVAKLLRDFSSKEAAKRVLDRAFMSSLKIVKESLEDYSSPDFRGDHNETEAIQRLNLHTAMTNGRHLLWLLERMIELRVADAAVQEWSNQASFTADLLRALRDDAWRNIVPGLPAVVLRCTCKLANAVAAGTILATRQVRMKLVKDWLPVLILCKDNVTPMMPSHKTVYVELEDTFLRIISTLTLPDAQLLLQQCLSFSTRNVDDCPHLVGAFTTWFRRANRFHHVDNLDM